MNKGGSSMGHNRVVITGLGIVSGLGKTIPEFRDALFAGDTTMKSLVGLEDINPRYTCGGQISDFDINDEMPDVEAKRLLRYSQFSMVAANRAINDAQLVLNNEDCARIGVSLGTAASSTGEGANTDVKRFLSKGDRGVTPTAWAEFTPCACSTHVAIHFGLRGPCATLSSGCVSGNDAIAWGMQQIRFGYADVMIVGGADCPFFPFTWAMMCRSGLLAPTPEDGRGIPRPFSKDHNGIALVEGGSAVVLESVQHAQLRGATIYAEILGSANTEEARPITNLDPTGEAFAMTMKRTLDDAGLPAHAVDWVLAHGTGFPIADCAESQGVETALGTHAFCIPVTSIRGALGQSFASGGGFQIAAACLAIQQQRVPPTINFTEPAEGCRLDYVPNVSRISRIRRVLINAAGVGGTHAGFLLAAHE